MWRMINNPGPSISALLSGTDHRRHKGPQVAYLVTYHITKIIAHSWFPTKVTGVEHIPPVGPVIIAANHLSSCDAFFLIPFMPRPITFMVKQELFNKHRWSSRALARYLKALGMRPVDRSGGATAAGNALREGKTILSSGYLLGVFPEGTRSVDGRLHPGKAGAAKIALDTGAPIVPVGLIGIPSTRSSVFHALRPHRVQICIGRPIDRKGLPIALADEVHGAPALRELTRRLMVDIQRLSGQQMA